MAQSSPKTTFCSFCGRPNNLVEKMIAGPDGVNICNECVDTCTQLLAASGVKAGTHAAPGKTPPPEAGSAGTDAADKPEGRLAVVEEPPGAEAKPFQLIPPARILQVLDEHVIGQEQAKKVLSVAVYNHYKRLNTKLHGEQVPESFGDDLAEVEVEKSNILLLGPTGSGKTLLARTLARVLDVPFAIADATTVTEAGYVGEDVETIVLRLLQAADFNVKRAETGIIYIDEIDKLALKGDSPHVSRNLGQGVQHALLKIIEGTVCNVPPQGGRKHPEQQYIQVDTANILFICGGAFVGLDEIVGRRIGNKFLGFDTSAKTGETLTAEQIMSNLQPEDLFNFGLIPEFVGRLPITCVLAELTQQDLERVLLDTKNSLTKQYRKLLAMEGVKLTFTPDGVSAIARKALKLKTGARGLRSILERMMLDTMYALPQHPEAAEVVINGTAVEGGAAPEIKTKTKAG